VKTLVDEYWSLSKIVMDIEREANAFDADEKKSYTARYPPKTPEEIAWIDKIITKLQVLIEEDRAEFEADIRDMSIELKT
jgi:hypothetical protein